MSVYFQYPAISEYPNLIEIATPEVKVQKKLKDEDNLNDEQIRELSDFLALKLV